jgi:hypothetical protein
VLAFSRLFLVSLVYVFFRQTTPHLCHVQQRQTTAAGSGAQALNH